MSLAVPRSFEGDVGKAAFAFCTQRPELSSCGRCAGWPGAVPRRVSAGAALDAGQIGAVMTLGGIAGMAVTTAVPESAGRSHFLEARSRRRACAGYHGGIDRYAGPAEHHCSRRSASRDWHCRRGGRRRHCRDHARLGAPARLCASTRSATKLTIVGQCGSGGVGRFDRMFFGLAAVFAVLSIMASLSVAATLAMMPARSITGRRAAPRRTTAKTLRHSPCCCGRARCSCSARR